MPTAKAGCRSACESGGGGLRAARVTAWFMGRKSGRNAMTCPGRPAPPMSVDSALSKLTAPAPTAAGVVSLIVSLVSRAGPLS